MKIPLCEIGVRVVQSEQKKFRRVAFRIGVLTIVFEFDDHRMVDLMSALWSDRACSYYVPVSVGCSILPKRIVKEKTVGIGLVIDAETLGAETRDYENLGD